jgi:hypothetical protein
MAELFFWVIPVVITRRIVLGDRTGNRRQATGEGMGVIRGIPYKTKSLEY